MKYDELELKTYEGAELAPIKRAVKKRRKVKVLDIVILQLVLCVTISAVVLTARVITAVATGGAVDFSGAIGAVNSFIGSIPFIK